MIYLKRIIFQLSNLIFFTMSYSYYLMNIYVIGVKTYGT